MVWKQIKIRIEPHFLIWVALLLSMIPVNFVLAAFVAALFHEMCHIAALKFFRYPVLDISVGGFGARIHTIDLCAWTEIIIALAGPLGGFLLIPFAKWIPAISLFAFIQSIYNLLPFYPMDGGRVLNCAIKLVFPERKAKNIIHIIQYATAILLAAGMIFVLTRK